VVTGNSTQEKPTPQGGGDYGLQPERTTLAWRRLAMSLLGAALVLARFALHRNVVLAAVTVGLALPLSSTVGILAWNRFLRAKRDFDNGRLPDGVLPAASALLAALMGVIGIGIVLLG
jgi:uncharacterized membrane protein YidH (DUF202 family)